MIRRRPHPATVLVGIAVVAYAVHFGRLTLEIHRGLGTSAYDLGLYDQGVWLLSRFRSPFVTLMGRPLFGDHTSFILLLLVPLYWIAPGAGALLFTQSAVIGAGAVPVYLVLRRRIGEWGAAALAAGYLLHPAVGWTNIENFHPDAFLGLTIGLALYGALDRRWWLYGIGVVASLLVKEDVSLVIVPLGVWVALRRDRRIGLLTIAGSVAYMALAMLVVMRTLIGVPTRNAWRIPFGGFGGVIRTALTRPADLLRYLISDGRPWYLLQMTVPTAFAFLRRPGVALISALVLFTNILSTFWYQYHVEYHYSLIAVPALVIGTGHALAALAGRARTAMVGAVLVAAVVAAYLWSPVPGSRRTIAHWAADHPVAVAAREIVSEVPDGASVSAHYAIAAHLAHRDEIYQFPNPFRIVLYGTDIADENGRLPERAERVEYLVLPVARLSEMDADFTEIAPAFDLAASNQFWELWRRDPTVALPPRGG